MRGSKILAGVGIVIVLGLLFIPALLVGNSKVGFQDYTLSQSPSLTSRYVPQASLYGPNPDRPFGWRVKGTVKSVISTYDVGCGTGLSGHAHAPTYTLNSTQTVVSHLNEFDTTGAGPVPGTSGAHRQAIIDVLWQELPNIFRGYGTDFPKVFPSQFFSLAHAKRGYQAIYGDGNVLSDTDRCNQQLSTLHWKTFWSSPIGWVLIILGVLLALYIIFAGRGGGGGGRPIIGHSTKHRGGSGSDLRFYGPGGTTTGRSTPGIGPGTSERIWLFPPNE